MQYDRTLLVSSRLVPSRCALCARAGPPGGSCDCQRCIVALLAFCCVACTVGDKSSDQCSLCCLCYQVADPRRREPKKFGGPGPARGTRSRTVKWWCLAVVSVSGVKALGQLRLMSPLRVSSLFVD